MIASDVYASGQWHDFFVMVGGATAALTGLVFVSMSLNVKVIAQDATHRNRAIGTLAGFIAVFTVCALALLGDQSHLSLGIEWLAVASVAGIRYVYGYFHAVRLGGSSAALRVMRFSFGTGCYLAQVVGAALLVTGVVAGLYVAAAAMIIYIPYLISGAWLLLVGVHREQPETEDTG
ncbi:MAG: hypothetical protein ACLPUG_11135 [Acidimicrobiales bacterium]